MPGLELGGWSVAITEARKKVGALVSYVASSQGMFVELTRQEEPSALLVSYDRFAPLLKSLVDNDFTETIRWTLTERWLRQGPSHLYGAQLEELRQLDATTVRKLQWLDPASASLDSLLEIGLPDALGKRLLRRYKIARAVAEATEAGLYETAEHHSNDAEGAGS